MESQDNLKNFSSNARKTEVIVPAGKALLTANLTLPPVAKGIVLFVHGSGSSRLSTRNIYVASVLNSVSIGTLLFDLLTIEEEMIDSSTGHLRFDINLLAERLIHVTHWVHQNKSTQHLKIGYFGASAGGAAAIVAAAALGKQISAIVSRGGRPDLANSALAEIRSPTLLIVGGYDEIVIELNRQAFDKLNCLKELIIIPDASHLFEEPGKLGEVAKIASDWFLRFLK